MLFFGKPGRVFFGFTALGPFIPESRPFVYSLWPSQTSSG